MNRFHVDCRRYLGIRYGLAPPSHIPSERTSSRQKSGPFSIMASASGLTAARSPGFGGLQGFGAPNARFAGWLEEMMCPSVCGRDGSVKNNDPSLSMMDRGLLNFNGVPALNCKCTASRFDPEPMRGSQAGMTAATAGGQPITSGRRSSTGRELQDRYAKNCASSAHAMPKSSMSRTLTRSGGGRSDSLPRHPLSFRSDRRSHSEILVGRPQNATDRTRKKPELLPVSVSLRRYQMSDSYH